MWNVCCALSQKNIREISLCNHPILQWVYWAVDGFYENNNFTNDTPLGHVSSVSLLSHAFLLESWGCWIRNASKTRHIHTMIWIYFVCRPLGRPGLPYFQSSYPICILGAILYSTLPSSPLALALSPCIPPVYTHVAVVLHSQSTNNQLLVTAVCVSNSTASSANRTAQCTPLSFDFLPLMTPDHPFKILQIIVSLQLPALASLPPQSKIGASP